ncbi:MAG TPA: HAMP domain-containing sensor histidine kinase [Actinomycetes bacterium]|jgi:signal transduction histidine kinase|nr:HAMP domain-containing sensor histidine kinase [Actinomycetes bacterium]
MAGVGAIGIVLLAFLATTVDVGRIRAEWSLVATLGAFLVVGHFFSVPLSSDQRGPRVLINSPFAFALALYGGIGAAALLYASTFVMDASTRRGPVRRVTFNVGTHTIGLASGGGVWRALSGGRPAGTGTLAAILAGTAVFVVVKAVLFAVKVRLDDTTPPDVSPARLLRHAARITLMTQAVVIVIVLAAGNIPVLLLALGLPTVAVYLMLRSEARANIGRNQAEQSARREAELRVQEHDLRLQQQEVTRKLQETDQLKDDLLAMVSHELRNPLSTVLGVLRLLSTGAQLSAEERQEMLEMADRQARRLRSLIEQLLLAARFERGETGYPSSGAELVETDAAELVLQAATEARAGHRDHPIRVECDGTLPVRVAPDAILQILGNLLDNACKYSPDERLVRLLAERQDGRAVLAVEDDGGGVPAAERERIFERFTQLGEGRGGLGLGLYIARQLARAQGGDLVLTEARHAGGARFELRLPLRQRANAPLPASGDGGPVVPSVGQPR